MDSNLHREIEAIKKYREYSYRYSGVDKDKESKRKFWKPINIEKIFEREYEKTQMKKYGFVFT